MLTSLTPKPKRTPSPHLRLATESWGLSVHILFFWAGLGTLDLSGHSDNCRSAAWIAAADDRRLRPKQVRAGLPHSWRMHPPAFSHLDTEP